MNISENGDKSILYIEFSLGICIVTITLSTVVIMSVCFLCISKKNKQILELKRQLHFLNVEETIQNMNRIVKHQPYKKNHDISQESSNTENACENNNLTNDSQFEEAQSSLKTIIKANFYQNNHVDNADNVSISCINQVIEENRANLIANLTSENELDSNINVHEHVLIDINELPIKPRRSPRLNNDKT